jgi:hypothetical protein
VPYLGWEPRHGRFEAVDDHLHVRALCLGSGRARALIMAVDLIGLGRGVIGAEPLATPIRLRLAQATGIPADRILVAATHAHSTPETSGITRLPATARGWLESFCESCVTAGTKAAGGLVPSELRFGRAVVDSVAQVRRRRSGRIDGLGQVEVGAGEPDRSVGVLLAQPEAGEPAALVNFACHPVLRQVQDSVSADYPGAVAAALGAEGTRTVFLQGACGDVNPVLGDHGSARDVEHDAAAIVAGVKRGLAQALVGEAFAGPVRGRSTWVDLPARPWPDGLDPSSLPPGRPREDARSLFARLGPTPDPWRAEVQVIRVGDLAVIGLPGEPFTETGLAIKAMSVAPHTMVVGYANDYLGYLAPPAAWLDGGYEVALGPWSLVGPAGAAQLVQAAVESVGRLWNTPGPARPEPATPRHIVPDIERTRHET